MLRVCECIKMRYVPQSIGVLPDLVVPSHCARCFRFFLAVFTSLTLLASVYAQSTATAPGQPSRTDAPLGQFEIVGNSIASAQQIFLGTLDKVYVVDKTERNPTQINGHPAWAAEYSVAGNTGRAMDVVTNSFCAGGNVLANGTWVNVGGNQAVTYGGLAASSQTGGLPYDDPDGGQSIRLLNPCDDSSCDWTLTTDMTSRRWYPTVETLEDGSVIILGGCDWGGFVNDASQNNPTWEIFPPTSPSAAPVTSTLLQNTLPANLYPLTWLLPSGKLLVQANWGTTLLDHKAQKEVPLDDMIHAVRTYPASAGTAMLPLTPANNWTATVLFCGGANIQANQWGTDWDIAQYNASNSCVTIMPDILCLNGASTGVAGYGNVSWAIGQSYADNPVLMPAIYDPAAPAGQKWSRDGLSASTIPRMYHSSASLLPDGSVYVAGSNPNADYNVGPNVKYPTEYRVERFYPSYYNQRRPEPEGLLTQLAYGGPYFNVTLSSTDLFGDAKNAENATAIVLRTGFSTHTMNMGQRFLQLDSTYTTNADGSAVLHVSQLPPNPYIFAPGPALLFVVVDGVPSVGVQVMVGTGQLGAQPTQNVADLPPSSVYTAAAHSSSGNSSSSMGHANQGRVNAAGGSRVPGSGQCFALLVAGALAVFASFAL
ncbi:Galactose oxidase [Grifola frondosa]|uniref:Galactose oxidase n=1 Tax=Grifola frondosa TaxID=5627 RepID=A0A1C7M192_GRIFR|nr:Galactose oxidase [Grifola frondosa]